MKIIKIGTVTISETDVVVDGFTFDGEGQGDMISGSLAAVKWAIQKLEKERDILTTNETEH